MPNFSERAERARRILSQGPERNPPDRKSHPGIAVPFPDALAPRTESEGSESGGDGPIAEKADVLILTWEAPELHALADVLTPGRPAGSWRPYVHRFEDGFATRIRAGTPAQKSRRLGSWCKTRITGRSVVCFNSALHLVRDAVPTNPDGSHSSLSTGLATLPLRDLILQLIGEIQPKLVISTGAGGATFLEHDIGDVVLTRAAKFKLADEHRSAPFNGSIYACQWPVPRKRFSQARRLMQLFKENLREPGFAPPTKRYPFEGLVQAIPEKDPEIKLDGDQFPDFHPALTTDYFEFGTSHNILSREGSVLEMGDAVVGLACQQLSDPPLWLIVRNIAMPQINGDLPTLPDSMDMQTHWACWYRRKFAYWTGVNSALACWAVIAGLE